MAILRIGIQGKGSSTVQDVTILADLLKKQPGHILEAVPEDDMLLRLDWLRQGKLDLFYESSYSPVYLEGKAPAEIERHRGPFPLNIAISAHSGAFGYMVRGDSPIKTIYDIGPETRFAGGGERVFALLAWLKLNRGPIGEDPARTEWNVTFVKSDGWEASLNAVPEGRANVAVATPQNPSVKKAAAGPHGIRFLDLPVKEDPEGVRRFRRVFPFSMLAPAPEDGVREIWGVTTMVGAGSVFCRPDLDEGLAYDLTRWFDVNYPLFKDKGNKLNTYTLAVLRWVADAAMAPVHPGTVRYFKEKGMWSKADDARGDYNRILMEWYCEAWSAALARAGRAGIAAASTNTEWLKLWADYKKEIRIPGYRIMTDEEIGEGLQALARLGH